MISVYFCGNISCGLEFVTKLSIDIGKHCYDRLLDLLSIVLCLCNEHSTGLLVFNILKGSR